MSSSSNWPENSASAVAAPLPSSSNFRQLVPPTVDPTHDSDLTRSNVFKLLAKRELCPQTKRTPRRFWGKASTHHGKSSGLKSELAKDVRQELRSWGESESLLHLSANYCPLLPRPRSTIAAAFSPDGKTLASTHGDHTVKIIDCQNGACLKVLRGHRRTPWVVRFHPLYPEVLASGSLDHEVRLWDAKTAVCTESRNFSRPIASIAFHAQGEILAVASGHKLYIWHYKRRRGESTSPSIILKAHRSLRAVHFHPNAAPLLLTAEVHDLDSSDSRVTPATSPGCLHYPPPTIYLADAHSAFQPNSGNEFPIMSIPFLIWPSISRGDIPVLPQRTGGEMSSNVSHQRGGFSASMRTLTYSTPSGQYEFVSSPIRFPAREEQQSNSSTREIKTAIPQPALESMETNVQVEERTNQFFPFGDPAYWEPFLQGWLIGQSQAGHRTMHSQHTGLTEGLSSYNAIANASSMVPPVIPNISSRTAGRSDSRFQSSRSHTRPTTRSIDSATFNSIPPEHSSSHSLTTQVQSEVATSLAAAAAAELPCTVKLRVWFHDVKNPSATLDTQQCRLTIPHAVLCSEMGAHFSPCGRFLAACVACILPNIDPDPGLRGQVQHDVTGASTSPTRHPISAHQVMYELRVYSLEQATFGSVLASRAIRAAHCLTSIRFSPTSDHLLLAYGRRHSSLLKSIVIDGDTSVAIYSILEIYRVSDMELLRVLPSAEDEVNVACFHPSVGGGFVYGTKEGKLRILQCGVSHGFSNEGSCGPDDNMFEELRKGGWPPYHNQVSRKVDVQRPELGLFCEVALCRSFQVLFPVLICL